MVARVKQCHTCLQNMTSKICEIGHALGEKFCIRTHIENGQMGMKTMWDNTEKHITQVSG